MIIDHANMQNSIQKYREGESRKSMSVNLKWGEGVTQFCVFGYKEGLTIFTAYPLTHNQTSNLFFSVSTKKVLLKIVS